MAILSRKKRLALAVKSIRRRLADGTPFDFSTLPTVETVLGDIVLGVQGMPWLTDADKTIFDPVANTYTADTSGAWQNIAPYSSSATGRDSSYWIYADTSQLGETEDQPHHYSNSQDWVYTGSTRMVNGVPKPWSTRACYIYDSNNTNGVLQDGTNGTANVIHKTSTFCDVNGTPYFTGSPDLETWCTNNSGIYYESCDSVGGTWHSSGNYYFTGLNDITSPLGDPAAKWGTDTLGTGATLTWSVIPSNTVFSTDLNYDPASDDSYTDDWADLPFTDYTTDFKQVFTEVSKACNLTFTEVAFDSTDSTHADIIIGYAPLEDKSSGVLAYAHFPEGDQSQTDPEFITHLSGNIMMDSNNFTWWSPTSSTIAKPAGSYNWRAIFRHELLHSLGLMHNLDTDSAVYTNPQNNVPETFLSDGDKAGLQYLYGESTFTNTAPVAGNASLTVANDSTLTIDFISHSSDANGDTMTLVSASATSGTMNGNVYTPPSSSFTGTDTISYTVTDGEDVSNTGTITVTVTEPATSTGTIVMTFSNPDVTNDGPYSIWADEFKFQVNGSWVYWGDLTGTPTFSATTFNASYPASDSLDGLLSTQGWWHITASTSYPITMTFNLDSASGEIITGIKYISATNSTYSDGSCDIDIEVDGVTKVTGAVLTPGTVGTNWENDFTW